MDLFSLGSVDIFEPFLQAHNPKHVLLFSSILIGLGIYRNKAKSLSMEEGKPPNKKQGCVSHHHIALWV